MSINAKQIQKINYFSKVPKDFCTEIANAVEQKSVPQGQTYLLKERLVIQCFLYFRDRWKYQKI